MIGQHLNSIDVRFVLLIILSGGRGEEEEGEGRGGEGEGEGEGGEDVHFVGDRSPSSTRCREGPLGGGALLTAYALPLLLNPFLYEREQRICNEGG